MKRPTKKTARKAKTVKRRSLARPRTPRHFFKKNDPFYLDERLIPAGWAYQWSTHVDPRSGWRAVPYSRHAHDFPKEAQGADGFIAIWGLVLTEIPADFVKAELANSTQRARDMVSHFDRSIGREEEGRRGFWIMPEGWLVSYSKEEVAELDPPPRDGPPVEVAVTLLMKVPSRWDNAAAYLKLTLNEYTRRRILMERPVLGVMDPFSAETVYEPVVLQFSPSKEV